LVLSNPAAAAPKEEVATVAGVDAALPLAPVKSEHGLADLPLVPDWEPGDPIKEIPRRATRRPSAVAPPAPALDPLLARQEQADAERGAGAAEPDAFGTPILNFAGGGFSGVNPPDTVGDVGLSHYVQLINAGGGAQIRVYNKSGTLVAGPVALDSLAPAATPCNNGFGDGVALYDQFADRWWLTEFSGTGNHLCIYVSTTGDPTTASWFLYDLATTNFPDYPHYAIWPDALFITTNESVPRVYALNRPPMLTGGATTAVVRNATALSGFGFQALTPVDADGLVPPPPGAPGALLRHVDTEAHGSAGAQDRLDLYLFSPNFTTPASSTFAGPIAVNVTEFDSDLCGLTSFSCIPQPSGANALDPLREVVMHRAQYRNFGRFQTIVGSFVTDTNGANRAGVRWFELRNTGAGWGLYQEGTYSPDATHRWMSSLAMDGAGEIALGYSVSSGSVFPGIRYVGRTAGAALGTMNQAEATVIAGSASNASNRWGDYAAVSVDPADECTFWFTTMYNAATSWSTRIATFKFDSCVPFVKGDINQSLTTDLVFRNTATGQNDFWLMSGVNRTSLVTLSPTPASLDWQIVGVDDFSGDNKNDLALWNGATGVVEFWLMNGTTRTGVAPLTGGSTLTTNWRLSATADFNRDGKPDIVWRNFTSQKIVIWTMNGTAKTGNIVPVPDQAVDANWEIVGAFDLNNDGTIDFLWYNPFSGKIVGWLMDANVVRITGSFTNPSNAGDANWKVLAAGDYGIGPAQTGTPQPGSRDVVWRNSTSGNVVVWHMDYALNRTGGVFTNPTAPSPNPTQWTIVGPR
jgi:hypothetical protein